MSDSRRRRVEEDAIKDALLSEPALADWMRDEENAAWAHLQDDSKADEVPATAPRGISGKEFLRFVGTMPPEDLDVMERVIEEECERIDPDEP